MGMRGAGRGAFPVCSPCDLAANLADLVGTALQVRWRYSYVPLHGPVSHGWLVGGWAGRGGVYMCCAVPLARAHPIYILSCHFDARRVCFLFCHVASVSRGPGRRNASTHGLRARVDTQDRRCTSPPTCSAMASAHGLLRHTCLPSTMSCRPSPFDIHRRAMACCCAAWLGFQHVTLWLSLHPSDVHASRLLSWPGVSAKTLAAVVCHVVFVTPGPAGHV